MASKIPTTSESVPMYRNRRTSVWLGNMLKVLQIMIDLSTCFICHLRFFMHFYTWSRTIIYSKTIPIIPRHLLNQLAVTLYQMGRFGNGASLQDIARISGGSEGAVEDYTKWCFQAIESLHDLFVRPLTREEKEEEKKWMDRHLGFVGTWREGWVMYDGTIVVLYQQPGLNSDAYYTWKANYGLNAQVCININLIFLQLLQVQITDWQHSFKFTHCWLFTWTYWLSSWCNCIWKHCSCKASRLVLWGWGICMVQFCLFPIPLYHSSTQEASSSLSWKCYFRQDSIPSPCAFRALYGCTEGSISVLMRTTCQY